MATLYRFTCPVCQQSQDFYSSGNHEGWLSINGEVFNSIACAQTSVVLSPQSARRMYCAKRAYRSVYGNDLPDVPPVVPM